MLGVDRGHISGPGKRVIDEACSEDLTGLVIDNLFIERRPDALSDRAVDLPVDDRRVDNARPSKLAPFMGSGITDSVFLMYGSHFARLLGLPEKPNYYDPMIVQLRTRYRPLFTEVVRRHPPHLQQQSLTVRWCITDAPNCTERHSCR